MDGHAHSRHLPARCLIIHHSAASCKAFCQTMRVAVLNVTSDHNQKWSNETQDITPLCLQMQFNRMASVCLPFLFLLFVLGWQSWPLISIMPIMQMGPDHILVQMSKASAEARSPLGPSGNLHFKAILCDKTMAQVLCPWPRALSSPVRQKVGVTPVSVPFLSAPGSAHSVWPTTEYRGCCQNELKRFRCFLSPPLHWLTANLLPVRS